MAVETFTKPVEAPAEGARMVHTYCFCSPDVGLCGKPLTGRFVPDVGVECVVCAGLADEDCPRCGR